MPEPTINPYNFVPLPDTGPERTSFPGWHRITREGYSGSLRCELEALSPLFSADHQKATLESSTDKRKWFPFLRNGRGEPILQGTTLKGMIRAVYEAMSNACLPMTATAGHSQKAGKDVGYEFSPLKEHHHDTCNSLHRLCSACSLFGVIQGDEVHAQGRVMFTDAVLEHGALEPRKMYLQELSSPKPHHYQIYSKTQGSLGPIAGRKFFYHQAPHAAQGVDRQKWSPRANGVTEVAPVGARFTFTLMLHSLTESEFAHLVCCLVLDDELGHKVGMGKSIGFGSCRIHINAEESALYRGETRYQDWHTPSIPLDVEDLKTQGGPIAPALREVLRLDKHQEGAIGYLSFRAYDGAGINGQGEYTWDRRRQRPDPQGSGVTLGEQAARQQQGQARPGEGTSRSKTFKQGDKIQVEVTAQENTRWTLRAIDTGQADIVHEGRYLPWKIGQRLRVTIVSMEPDGRIKKIRP